MSSYQITIAKTEPTVDFDKKLEEFNSRHRIHPHHSDISRRDYPDMPRPEVIKDVLIVELTEEQFRKVKKEVLSAFE